MPAHKWEDTVSPEKFGDMDNCGRRRCTTCGAEQTKQAKREWGWLVGYQWLPLVGRCKSGSAEYLRRIRAKADKNRN